MRRFSLFRLAALLGVLLLSACASLETKQSATSGTDRLSPSPYEVVGRIALVDPGRELAVIDLEPYVRSIAGPLTARNEILRETATLEPTGQRRGRSLGVRIVKGLPNVGDEVVVRRE